jgi:putative ABC transport system permease protein
MRELLAVAIEALDRYWLRTSLSVLGVVVGVAAVIAMMSVSEGAARESLAQMETLGLDNLVARSQGSGAPGSRGLTAGDADRVASLVPFALTASPLIEHYVRVGRADRSVMAPVLGVRPAYQTILRLSVRGGRFLSAVDEAIEAQRCVLGGTIARQLFGYRNPLGERIHIAGDYYEVVGVLPEQGADPHGGSAIAWHDVNQSVLVPFATLSGRSLRVAPEQPADEIWLQVQDSRRADELAAILEHVLVRTHGGHEFNIVVPRALLAQRYRTQRTFSVVVGSVAALTLLVGGIGIMNIMLASVVERTREIGVRRTVGATRRDVTFQFLIEALMMTVGGGAIGVVLGVLVSWGITAFAGWSTHVSAPAVLLALCVSLGVGLTFGLYPALKAARLEPVDAMRYE